MDDYILCNERVIRDIFCICELHDLSGQDAIANLAGAIINMAIRVSTNPELMLNELHKEMIRNIKRISSCDETVH
jgi:hypothetical protein